MNELKRCDICGWRLADDAPDGETHADPFRIFKRLCSFCHDIRAAVAG